MIRSLAGCFTSDWIRIIYIRPARKPPDKTEPISLRYRSLQLIVFCGAMIANAYRHQLIVKSITKPASFKIIVESASSCANQNNSELSSLQAFEMKPTDPSKTTTAIATIAPIVQPTDSATSTMTIEPNVPFVKPTVDPSISSGEAIFEPREYFVPARRILFDNTDTVNN